MKSAKEFLIEKYGANFESEDGSIKPKQFWLAIAGDMEEYASYIVGDIAEHLKTRIKTD